MPEERNMHYVTTHQQAKELALRFTQWSVSDCGCRLGNPEGCKKSPTDVCLVFSNEGFGSTETNKRILDRKGLDDLFELAKNSKLVARPFRDFETRSVDSGICFCCDDCCGYFLSADEPCDKGTMIESTSEECVHCGGCIDICYFKSRQMVDGQLVVDKERCYGCGLCVDECQFITMVER
jgi:ferredoxin